MMPTQPNDVPNSTGYAGESQLIQAKDPQYQINAVFLHVEVKII